jgi:hypothetical protein
MDKLRRMTNRELEEVPNFAIGNQYGLIEWEGLTDIRGIDFDEVVTIEHEGVEVYPESRYPTEDSKPDRGTKLNKTAIITLYNCKARGSAASFKKRIQAEGAVRGFDLLDYEPKSGTY